MGNEQSGAGSSSSFGAGTGPSGIVVVRPGAENPIGDPKDDENLKRLQEIPQFYPMLRNSLHLSGVKDPPDLFKRLNPQPIIRFCYRLQEHLHENAKAVAKDQNSLIAKIREVDVMSGTLTQKLTERAKHQEKMAREIENVRDLADQMAKVQVLLQSLVPCVETLNELLVPSERLPPLNLGRYLDRTPKASFTSSSSSSLQSTPAHRAVGSSAAPSGEQHIAPIAEDKVVDLDG